MYTGISVLVMPGYKYFVLKLRSRGGEKEMGLGFRSGSDQRRVPLKGRGTLER